MYIYTPSMSRRKGPSGPSPGNPLGDGTKNKINNGLHHSWVTWKSAAGAPQKTELEPMPGCLLTIYTRIRGTAVPPTQVGKRSLSLCRVRWFTLVFRSVSFVFRPISRLRSCD